jgi:hypothetical protein
MATTISTFAQADAACNDATRRFDGGLWRNVVGEEGLGLGRAGSVVGNLPTVEPAVRAQDARGQLNDPAVAQVHNIIASLDPMVAANAATSGGGVYGKVASAGSALRRLHRRY